MLKKYKAVVNGYETTLLLSEKDAEKRGLVQTKAAEKPANKASEPAANKAAKKAPAKKAASK